MKLATHLLGIVFLLSVPLLGLAQLKEISGTVVNERNEPVPSASIIVKGSFRGTSTKETGTFSLKIPPNAKTLVISSTGYTTLEVKITSSSVYQIVLKGASTKLEDVVVTAALGIKQKKKALGYSVQEINTSELNKGNENNFVNALQGKVAGLNVTTTGGAAGSGSDLVIRGISSLSPSANNQPLIVVDGMPMNNSTNVANVMPSSGSNGNQSGSNDQFAFANRGIDINPDDIESVSVLKGAGATALYGLQAANGVIIITTKKGKAGVMNISVNSSLALDYLTKYPEIQTKYREGSNGRVNINYDGTLAGTPFQTFGPPVTKYDTVYNNFKNAFVTGNRYDNFISLQGGSNKATYYSSFSALNQDGILKYTGYDRYTFKLAGTYQATDKLSVSGSATLISSKTTAPSAGDKGVMTALAYHTTTVDVRNYMNPDGSMKCYSPGIIDNPLYVARFSQMVSNLSRFVGNMGFSYNVIPHLKVDYKIGGDFYSNSSTRIVPGPRYSGDPATLDLAGSTKGFMVEDRVIFRDVTSNLYITWQDKLGEDFDYTIMGGNNIEVSYSDDQNVRGETFVLPGFYDLSNTTYLYATRTTDKRRYAGIFGSAKIGYKNGIFLELTGRNDWSSTLPTSNNSFFYPAVSLSYVFTELHHLSNSILNFGKLRLSYAQVGKDAQPYMNGPYYASVTGFPFVTSSGTTVAGFLRSSSYSDPNLKPEMQKSFELGTELHFFKDRLNFDISYYNSKDENQIIPVPISYTGGYSIYNTNAGSLRNTGVEVNMDVTPIRQNNFKWNFVVNWFTNKSKVVSIKDGISAIDFYDEGRIASELVKGGSAGDLYGYAYTRNKAGKLLISQSNGYPIPTSTYVKVGNALPDWVGSISNTVTYKNFSLSFLLEYRNGGKMYDVTMRNSIRNGVLKSTEKRYVQVVFDGVSAKDSTTANAIPVVIDHNYYRNSTLYANVADNLLQNTSWLRLRNLTFSYSLPKKLLSNTKIIKGAVAGVTLSNLILWTRYSGYDPESTAFSAGYNVYGFTGSNIPSYSSVIFNLNFNF